ncbi:MAG: peptide-methionine (S)-S-oxide reductase [Cytophagales bacterium]|nr:peptide-methionine (S)-S-oxide reductase [Cytophagales bacterium]
MEHLISFGGGCHWCTEGIFQSLKGVRHADQEWIGSDGRDIGTLCMRIKCNMFSYLYLISNLQACRT